MSTAVQLQHVAPSPDSEEGFPRMSFNAIIRPMPGPVLAPQIEPAPDQGVAALVRAARAGDSRACREIWARHAGLVQRLVRRFFGPGPDLADVCQEAFLRVFRRLGELREPAALPGFITGITLGVARNEARRRRIRALVGLASPEELSTVATAETQAAESREAVRALYRLLDGLSAEDRSLFVARYIEKMELTEVAAAHELSLSTLKRRLSRLAGRVNGRLQSEPALATYAGLLGGAE